MDSFTRLLTQYEYSYPESLIAQEPAKPRDSARLLVYDRKSGTVLEDTFHNLPDYVPAGSVVVCNQTKVLPARFEVRKSTGGKVVLLYISHQGSFIRVMADRKLQSGTRLQFANDCYLDVVEREDKLYVLKPGAPVNKFLLLLNKTGVMPLPPYIKHTTLTGSELRRQYQTVFSNKPGAVAAPTASLHFTRSLLTKLKRSGVTIAFITLHVGLGTFAPLTSENVKRGKLHQEYYTIDKTTAQLLNAAKKHKRPIVAVGTTVVRTLESACIGGRLRKLSGTTDIFIQEHTKLRFVDSLITNFHIPRSSLLMLVAAFIGRKKLFELYQFAIKKRFRLFSFGDGMYIK